MSAPSNNEQQRAEERQQNDNQAASAAAASADAEQTGIQPAPDATSHMDASAGDADEDEGEPSDSSSSGPVHTDATTAVRVFQALLHRLAGDEIPSGSSVTLSAENIDALLDGLSEQGLVRRGGDGNIILLGGDGEHDDDEDEEFDIEEEQGEEDEDDDEGMAYLPHHDADAASITDRCASILHTSRDEESLGDYARLYKLGDDYPRDVWRKIHAMRRSYSPTQMLTYYASERDGASESDKENAESSAAKTASGEGKSGMQLGAESASTDSVPASTRKRRRPSPYISHNRTSFRSHLVSHRLPTHCSHVQQFSGRAFAGKFSHGSANPHYPSMFAVATQDGIVHLYETDGWKLYKEVEGRDIGRGIVDLDFSLDSRFIIYSSWSNAVHIANAAPSTTELHEALDFSARGSGSGHHSCMFGIRFSPNGNREILAGLNGGDLVLYDIEQRRASGSIHAAHMDDCNSVCWMEGNDEMFVTGGDDATISVWDRRMVGMSPTTSSSSPSAVAGPTASSRTPRAVGGFIGHTHGITCVSTHPQPGSPYVLSNSKDQSMKLFDLRRMNTCTQVRQVGSAVANNPGYDYRWHQPTRMVIRRQAVEAAQRVANAARTETRNSTPDVDTQLDRSVCTYTGHSVGQTLIRCEFSPMSSTGSRYGVTGSSDSNIYIYDLLTGEIVSTLSGHDSIVRDISCHHGADGCLIVSSSWDHTIRRWSMHKEKFFHDNEAEMERAAAARSRGVAERMGMRLRRRA